MTKRKVYPLIGTLTGVEIVTKMTGQMKVEYGFFLTFMFPENGSK